MIQHTIPAGVVDAALSKYLSRAWPMVSAYAWRELFQKRDARVNGVRSGADTIVRAGDELTLYLPEKYAPQPLKILFEDGEICAFVKPRGLPTDTDAHGVGADTVLSRLRAQFDEAHLAHRLDAGTGGVMLAALNERMESVLDEAFRGHAIQKTYECCALGAFEQRQKTLRAYITKDARASKVRVADESREGALPACLKYTVLDKKYVKGLEVTRLEIALLTGRTHQIRAQLAHIGHPIIGDDKYGDYEANKRLGKRDTLLWCKALAIGAQPGLEAYEGMRFHLDAPDWELL